MPTPLPDNVHCSDCSHFMREPVDAHAGRMAERGFYNCKLLDAHCFLSDVRDACSFVPSRFIPIVPSGEKP